MKKILSVLLAVMMLFGTLAVSSSAASTAVDPTSANAAISALHGSDATGPNGEKLVTVCFMLNGGSFKVDMPVYDPTVQGSFSYTKTPGDEYYRIPMNTNEMYVGWTGFNPPAVTAPEGKEFVCWEVQNNVDGKTYTLIPGYITTIEEGMICDGNRIVLLAQYTTAAADDDTLGTILGVLIKVFGAIVGILFYNGDTKAGAALIEGMISGIL